MNDVAKGNRAKAILEDELFQEAVSEVAKALVAEWQHSKNAQRREELWNQQAALTKLVSNLTAYMENGVMANHLTSTKEGFFK